MYCENPKYVYSTTPVLTLMEIDDYDDIKAHDRLYVNVRKAMEKCKVRWRTVDVERIKSIIRQCIIREINQIEGRKNAREYRATHGQKFYQDEMGLDHTQVKSAQDF